MLGGSDWERVCLEEELGWWEGVEEVEHPSSPSTLQEVTVTKPAPRPSGLGESRRSLVEERSKGEEEGREEVKGGDTGWRRMPHLVLSAACRSAMVRVAVPRVVRVMVSRSRRSCAVTRTWRW